MSVEDWLPEIYEAVDDDSFARCRYCGAEGWWEETPGGWRLHTGKGPHVCNRFLKSKIAKPEEFAVVPRTAE